MILETLAWAFICGGEVLLSGVLEAALSSKDLFVLPDGIRKLCLTRRLQ